VGGGLGGGGGGGGSYIPPWPVQVECENLIIHKNHVSGWEGKGDRKRVTATEFTSA